MSDRGSSLIKNTAILSFGTLCTKGIMFLMTPLLTRWLSQNDYGIYDLLITYVTLLIPFITLDCGEAAFRFLAETNDDERNKRKVIVSSSFFVALLGFCIAGIIILAIYFFYKPLRDVLPYFFVLLICEALNTFCTFLVRGLKKLPIYAFSNILYVTVMAILAFLFVRVFNWGLSGVLLAYSGGYVVSIIFSTFNIKIYRYISIKDFSLLKLRKMLKFSLPLMPNAISWWIINVSDRTIVSVFLGTATNAVYAVANKIPNLCQTLFNVFHLSWQENAVETLNDSDRDSYYTNVMNKMLEILGSICIAILAINFLFFKILFTQDYFAAYYQVPILILSIMLSMLAQFIGGIYIAKMESKKNGVTTAMAAVINIIVHLCLVKYIGLYAATISTLISYGILVLVRFFDIRKSIRLRLQKRAIIMLIVLIYFFASNYIYITWLNWVNVLLASIYFVYSNYGYANKIVQKLLKKGK